MNKITETVDENKAPERIDVFTSEIAAVTRSRAAALIADGCVTVNGQKASKSDKVKSGDTVTVTVPEPAAYDIAPENCAGHFNSLSEFNQTILPSGSVTRPFTPLLVWYSNWANC